MNKIMNKKVMKATFIAAIVMMTGINVFNAQKSEPLSDIVLANVEALADKSEIDNGGGNSGINPLCPNGCLDEIGDGCYCYRFYPDFKEAVWP